MKKKKPLTREVAVYMENIHSSSPGVRVYMDNDPQARIVEPAKGQTSGRKRSDEKQQQDQKGVRKLGLEEKISPRIGGRDCEAAIVLRSATGPDSLLTPRPPLTHQQQRCNPAGNDNEVSRSQVISSQSFPVTMSRGEKYVFCRLSVHVVSVVRLVTFLFCCVWKCSFNLLQHLSPYFLIILSGKTETTFGPEGGVFSSTSFTTGHNAVHTPVTTAVRPKRYILSSPAKRSPSKALGAGSDPLLQDDDDEDEDVTAPSGPGPSGGVVIYYSPTSDPAAAASIQSSANASPTSVSSSSSHAAAAAGDSGAGSSSSSPSKAGSRNNNLIISSCSQFVDYEISV